MKTLRILSALSVLLCMNSFAFSQIDTAWVRTWDSQNWDEIHAVATDASNNIYVAGWSYEWGVNEDFIFAKYDPDGNLLWSKIKNYASGDQATHILVDEQGYVFVAGFVYGSYSTTGGLLCLMKYTTNGDSVWEYIDNNTSVAQVSEIAMDHSGNIIIAGFDGGTMGSADFVTIKVDSAGNGLWFQSYNNNGPNESNRIRGLCIDGNDNIYVTGSCDEWTYFASDIFTIKYAPNGDTLWMRQFNSPANDYDAAYKILLNPNGDLVIGGQVSSSGPAQTDYVILKYDTAGNLKYSKYFNYPGPQSFDNFNDMLIDASGNIYLVGNSSTNNAQNTVRLQLIKFNNDGDTLWTSRWGPGFGFQPTQMVMDDNSNVYIAGHFYDDVNGSGISGFAIRYDADGTIRWETVFCDTTNLEEEFYALALDANKDLIAAGRVHSDNFFDFLTVKYRNSVSGLPGISTLPSGLSLQCVPNPVNGTALFTYTVPVRNEVGLRIVDLTGRVVAEFGNFTQAPGRYTMPFSTAGIKPGLYIAELVSGSRRVQEKIIIEK